MTALRRPHVPLPSEKERANAKVVSLDALPDPGTLEAGTLVIVNDATVREKSLVRSVLGVLGRKKNVPRAVRCTALVARGYIRVGAGTDPDTSADLVWGYAPLSDGMTD